MPTQDQLSSLLDQWNERRSVDPALTLEDFLGHDPGSLNAFRDFLQVMMSAPQSQTGAPVPPGTIDAGPAPPTLDGRYLPYRFHAQGGLGVVYVAKDRELGRDVALKMMQPYAANNERARRRFVAEAELTGWLEHPGIVPVYGILSDPAGQPYYAMRFIGDETLEVAIRKFHSTHRASTAERNVAARKLIQHFVAICETVGYAHSRGVIHRDLKPKNIMIGPYGETLVVDWGLAKILPAQRAAAAAGITDTSELPTTDSSAAQSVDASQPGADTTRQLSSRQGSIMGTPAYMPPEQARGEIDKLDPRTDVFSLGAILCEILTNGPAYRRASAVEIQSLAAFAKLEDAFARLDSCGADPELIAIARRCLAAEQADRPADASAVAREIVAYQAGVEERLRKTELERAATAAKVVEERRRRRAQLAFGGTALALLLVAGVATWWIQKEESERKLEDQKRDQERAVARSQNDLATENALDKAENALGRQRLGEADAALVQAEARLGSSDRADLHARLEKAKKDREMVVRLDSWRDYYWSSLQDDPFPKFAPRDLSVMLEDYGISLAPGDPVISAELVRQSSIRDRLIEAMYDWFAIGDDTGKVHMAEILNLLDPNPRFVRIRNAIVQKDYQKLETELDAGGPIGFSSSLGVLLSSIPALNRPKVLRILHFTWEQNPSDPTLLYRMSMLVRPKNESGDRLVEMGLLRAVLALRPNNWAVWNGMGVANKARGNFNAALSCYNRALEISPDNFLLYYNLGNCLLEKGDKKEAIAAFQKSIDLGDTTGKSLTNLGVISRRDGNLKDAIENYRKAVTVNPKRQEAWFNLGKALAEIKENKESQEAFSQAAQIVPISAADWARKSYVLSMLERYPEAIEAAKKATELDPKDANAHRELGRALSFTKKFEESVAALRQAIECDSKDFDNYFILALVYFQMNDIKSSADTFRKAVAIDPKNLGARMNLAVMLKKLGDYKGVEQVLRDTVALNPKYSFGHLELGKFLAEVGDNNGAINAFRDAIAINSKSADAHSQLGLALRNTGEYEKALESFRTAAILSPEKSPGQDNARQNIKVAERMRELEKAIPDVLAGKQLVGDDGPLLLAVCLQTKRYASAVEIYKLVLAKLPKLADNPASAHRYNAACAAVLAANGKGRDSATLSAEQKGHLRREALTWLKADLEAWSKLVKTNKPEQAKLVEGQMRHWLEDGDLESVRNPESLKSLPESERQEWQKLWQGVRELSGLAKEPKK